MNKILKTLLTLIFCVFLKQWSFSQTTISIVYFKNGTSIKGQIVALDSLRDISIMNEENRVYQYNMSDVEKIISAPIESNRRRQFQSRQNFTPSPRGPWISADFQGLNPPGMSITGGYKFHQFGFIGLGTGFNNYFGTLFSNGQPFTGIVVPVYVRYSGDILKRRTTPFYALEVGYGFAVNESRNPDFGNTTDVFEDTKRKGGVYGSLGFGVKFLTNKKVSFGLCLNYKVQQASLSYTETLFDPNTGDEIKSLVLNKYVNQRFGLKLIFVGWN